MRRYASLITSLLALAAACRDLSGPTTAVRFLERSLNLDTLATHTVTLQNAGNEPAVNIRVEVTPLKTTGGDSLTGTVTPSVVENLPAREGVPVTLAVNLSARDPAGEYLGWLRAEFAGVDSIPVRVRRPGPPTLRVLGNGAVTDRYTSDLWVTRSPVDGRTYAYTGTWGLRQAPGNALFAWDATDPAMPLLTDSVLLDAATVNDVKVSADGLLAVATHEGSSPNGITLLSLADPAHPDAITRYTSGLTNGVHNAWIEDIGTARYVFACHDGDPAFGLKVIDVTTPSNPRTVAEFGVGSAPNEVVHDVFVRDGLAFVSHWDAGLVIVDVGANIAGGSPASPREVSRLVLPEGRVHNAWWWPERGLVFVGHEFPGAIGVASGGLISVLDVSDVRQPLRVATFRVTGAGPHNFWVHESAGILYSAYYNAGLLAIDVTGRLLGELDRQERLIAQLPPEELGGAGNTYVWAPQLVAPGRVMLSDMITGLWAVSVAP